ncbi:efflux RND transporter periplasmic adaptor subunit [bacterium]|nr:efflux RND transporter periplasmic adaptor subunit [bacterium]
MIFSKKILTVSLGILVIGFVSFFLFFQKGTNASSEESSQSSGQAEERLQERPLPVRVVEAQKRDLVIKLSSPGEAVTRYKVVIKAEVPGRIDSLKVEEGQHVKEGDLLVHLEEQKYKLSLQRAEASYLKALSELLLENRFAEDVKAPSSSKSSEFKQLEKEFKKAQKLYEKGYVSREDFEKLNKKYKLALIESGEKREEIRAAVKGVTQAEVDVKKAQMELDKTQIWGPFSGIVCNIQVSPKEYVSSSQELFTLVDIRKLQVHATVLESEIGKIEEGREARLRFSSYPSKVFKGRVKAVSPIVTEDKTCKVVVEMRNPEEKIKPGMHAEVEISAEIYEDRLLVPQEAVLVRGGRKLVFAVEDGLTKWKYVDTGMENENYAEILEGIEVGDRIIVEGHLTLAHDAKVRVVE